MHPILHDLAVPFTAPRTRIPVFWGQGPMANYFSFRRNPLELLEAAARDAEVQRIRIAYETIHLFNTPESVREILLDRAGDFDRGKGSPEALAPHIGRGVLTTSGSEWAGHRKGMRQQLKPLERLEAAVSRYGSALRQRWIAGGVFNAPMDALAMGYQVAMDTIYGYEASFAEGERYAFDFTEAHEGIFQYLVDGIPGANHLPTPRKRRLSRAIGNMRAESRRLVRLARSGALPEDAPGVAGLAAADEAVAVDEVMNVLAAAPENPANTMGWLLFLLGSHPRVLAQARAEVEAELDGAPTLASVRPLAFCRAVINETMRLYPGAWGFEREVLQEGSIAGYALRPGELCFVSPYLLHRSPRLWDEPDVFRPQRFVDEPAPKDRFVPFGLGPRRCVGARYAEALMQLLVPMLITVPFELEPGQTIEVQPMFTLRARHGIHIRVPPARA